MKKYFLYIAAAAFLMIACNKEQQLVDPPEEPVAGIITMTTQVSEVIIWVGITSSEGSDNFAIDWGDGKISNLNDASSLLSSPYPYDSYSFEHYYSAATEHRITITGDNFYAFECAYNPLTSLDVSRYPELTFLYCSDTQLTALDVSNNTDLYYLSCSRNQLTASALNDLFRTLPDKAVAGIRGYIYIGGNPGEYDCDFSIASKKGWSSSHPGKSLEEENHVELYLNYLKLINNHKIKLNHEK